MGRRDPRAWLHTAKEAAYRAGCYLSKREAGAMAIEQSTHHDLKIAADKQSEHIILTYLQDHSQFPVLTEESGLIPARRKAERLRWIVDPLDGTINYTTGIPFSCVSVALWEERHPLLGVVYDFNRNELFSGIVGEGAWANDESITVSQVTAKSGAIVLTGFPVATDFSTGALLEFVESIQTFKKIRLLGSAALSLAYVAAGRVQGYREKDIKIWDVAAGMALVLAAGGSIRTSFSDDGETLLLSAGCSKPIVS